MGLRVPLVPPMSTIDCERRARAAIRRYNPELLETPGALDVPDFFEHHLRQAYRLKPGVADLPAGVEGLTRSTGEVLITRSIPYLTASR